MRKLILTHLRRRMANYIAVCVELTILILVSNVLLSQMIPFIQTKQLYDEMRLSQILCCTVNSDRETVQKLAENADATLLWRNYIGQSPASNENLYIQPVEKSYLQRFKLISENLLPQGAVAVIPHSLKSQYEVGQTYTLAIDENIGEVAFTVIASLDSDLMFLPPSGNSTLSIIGNHANTILLALDDADLSYFNASDIYTMEAENAQQAADNLSFYENVVTVMSCEAAQDYDNAFELEEMGIPIILSITAIVLCLAGMLSNTLLTIIANERTNGIYYICGYTWKKCALVQVIGDFCAVLLSIVFATATLLVLENTSGYIALEKMPFVASAVIIALIYAITEALGIQQMKKNNVAEIAERMK